MDDSTAIGSSSGEDEKWDIAAVLGETLVATVTDDTAENILRESGAVDVIDETEVLVASGTAQSKKTISYEYTKMQMA